MSRLLRFELRRILARPLTRAGLLALVILTLLLTISTYNGMYASDGLKREGAGAEAVSIDKEVAARYSGPLTDEKVQQILADFHPTTDLHGLNAAFFYRNATQSAIFRRFADAEGNWNGLLVEEVFGEGEVRLGYVYGWLSVSRDLTVLTTLASFVIILSLAPIFTGEYNGPDSILFTSRYGRSRCVTAKQLAALLFSLLPVLLAYGVSFIAGLFLYGPGGLGCSVLLGPAGFIEDFIPVNYPAAEAARLRRLYERRSSIYPLS